MDEKATFEASWPTLEPQLRGALTRRGVPFDIREDVLQETALRLLRNWDRVRPESLWAFALTVALNIVRDEARARDRRERVIDVDRPNDRDPEHEALVRLELDRVRTALASMPVRQQTILLTEIGEAATTESPSAALKMARMRARRRLRTLIEDVSVFIPAQLGRIRRWVHNAEGGAANAAASLAVQLTAITAFSAVAVPAVLDQGVAGSVPRRGSAHAVADELGRAGGRDRSVARSAPRATLRLGHPGQVRAVGPSRRHRELNQHFGVVHKDGGSIWVGGDEQVGPYGVDQGVDYHIGGSKAGAKLRARYRAARCTNRFLQRPHSPCGRSGRLRGRIETEFDGERRKLGIKEPPPVS